MGRRPCCSKEGMNRGAWTVLEDKILTDYICIHGEGRWGDLSKKAGLKRCGKSCRLRWLNYLRPDIKRGNISLDEEELIIRLHNLLGNRWSLIAGRLPGRTDNEIKNYWNTSLSKKVQGQASTPKHSIHYSDEEKSKKKKKKKTMRTPLIMESAVVRTTPYRCNRVFLSPHPNNNQEVADGNGNKTTFLEPETEGEGEPFMDNKVELDSYDGLTSFNPVLEEEEDSLNLMIDLDDDCCFFSDLLINSDLFEFGNGEAGEGSCYDGNSNESLPSWDQTVLCGPEAEEELLDFPSLTSLLGQVESWLED